MRHRSMRSRHGGALSPASRVLPHSRGEAWADLRNVSFQQTALCRLAFTAPPSLPISMRRWHAPATARFRAIRRLITHESCAARVPQDRPMPARCPMRRGQSETETGRPISPASRLATSPRMWESWGKGRPVFRLYVYSRDPDAAGSSPLTSRSARRRWRSGACRRRCRRRRSDRPGR